MIQVPPLRSTQPAANIPGFFKAVGEALKLHVKSEGTPNGTQPVYVHAFPRERLQRPDDPFDVITFRVLDAGMAPTGNDGRTPRAPSRRELKPHPNQAGYNLAIQGWWEQVRVEFSVWSRSNSRADELTNWFHLFLMRYAFFYDYLEARGVSKFKYVGRQDEDVDLSTDQELYRRRLVYEFRLEYLDAFMEKLLESASVEIGVERPTDKIELTE